MTREDVAKAYINLAHGRAARAGVIAVGAGLALLVLWGVEFRSRTGEAVGVLAEKPRFHALTAQRAEVQSSRSELVEARNAAQAGSKRAVRISKYDNDLQAQARRLQQQAGAIAKQAAEVRQVTFRLPGFPEFTVNDTSAALVWLICAAVLFQYLFWCRRSVLTLYSRALRILVFDAKVSPSLLNDIAGPLPFWIAPLPRGDGRHVPAALLRSAVGWDRSSRWNYLCVALLQLAICLVVMHVVYLGVIFSQVILNTFDPAALIKNSAFLPITLIFGIVFGGIAFWWLTPDRVPDSYSFEVDAPAHVGSGRRALIVAGLGLVAAATSLVVVSPTTMRKMLLRPRFRRWSNRGTLAVGFYEVGRNKRVHYVRSAGRPRMLKSVPDRYIRATQIDKDQMHRIHDSALATWVSKAMQTFNVNEYELAKEGIARAPDVAKSGKRPSLIWFDRAAEAAFAAKNRGEVRRILDALNGLAAVTAEQRTKDDIEQRRGYWNARLARLTS